MTNQAAFFVQTYYSGTALEKLTVARGLHERHASRLMAEPLFRKELNQLQQLVPVLAGHMQSMGMGLLCSLCATQNNGGCCSASMADNTDSIQILINLLLGVKVQHRANNAENCCFLGDQGCFFLVKPIFCLNYNCRNILDSAEAERLEILYRLAATVLSQQTRVESLLLDRLGDAWRKDQTSHKF